MANPEDSELEEQSEHLKAIAKHARRRAARKPPKVPLTSPTKSTGRGPRTVDKSLEPKPSYAGTTAW
jgi:hypothetical protein